MARGIRGTVAVVAAIALTVAGGAWAGARGGGAAAAPNGGWRVFSVAGTAAYASPSFGTPVPGSVLRRWEAGVAYAASDTPLSPLDIAVEADGGYLIASPGWGLVRVRPNGAASMVAGTVGRSLHNVAVAPDGSVLFADGEDQALQVRRLAPDGRITVVAGTGRPGLSGDGGPAVRARLGAIGAIAATRDNGFLIADYEHSRVRRVNARGVIRTVAGSRRDGMVGDGGPATRAGLGSEVLGLAALPDGGFLIAADDTRSTIRRVNPNGTITRLAGGGRRSHAEGIPATGADLDGMRNIAVAPDGSVLVADFARVRRIDPAGRIRTIAGSDREAFEGVGSGVVNGMGGAPRVARLRPTALAVTPDGDILVAESEPDLVVLLARPQSTRLAAAIRAVRVIGRRPRLTLMATAGASAQLTVYSGRRRVASVRRDAPAGRSTITLDRPLRPGSYTIRVVLRDAAGRVATDRARVIIGRRLSLGAAADALDARFCRRFGPRRVDCTWETGSDEEEDKETKCTAVLLVPATGQRRLREYECPLRRVRTTGMTVPDHSPHWLVPELRM